MTGIQTLKSFEERLVPGDIVMLTSTTSEGMLVSRPMVLRNIDEDGTLLFLGTASTLHAAGIGEGTPVNVTSTRPEQWMSIAGTSRLLHDPRRTAELWDNALEEWIPSGLKDPDLVVLRVQPGQIEAWDETTHEMVSLSKPEIERRQHTAAAGQSSRRG